MQNSVLFENFSTESLIDSTKFAKWIAPLYHHGNLHGHLAVQPFAEELVERFFHYLIPLDEKAKKEFIDKFTNYWRDGDRYSFDLEALLAVASTNCASLRTTLIQHAARIRNEAEKYLLENNAIAKDELTSLFYHLRHNMGGSDIYNKLSGITANVHYLNEHSVVSKEDLEDYLNNYYGKEKEFGCRALEKFKKDRGVA